MVARKVGKKKKSVPGGKGQKDDDDNSSAVPQKQVAKKQVSKESHGEVKEGKKLVQQKEYQVSSEESSSDDSQGDNSSNESSDSSADDDNVKDPKDEISSNDTSDSEEEEQDGDDGSSSSDEDEGNSKQRGKVYSDQNKSWLKPKKTQSQLLSSDSSENESGNGSQSSDDDDDDEEEMEVERQSRLLDAEKQLEDEEAEEEMRETVSRNTAIYHLPTTEELERDVDRVVPPSELRSHIESILEVLAAFSSRREEGRSRSEYVEQLGAFLSELHGYLPELVQYFLTMFGPAETLEFLEYSDKPRPMVIRTNTLKTRRKDLALALMKRGVTLDPLSTWSKVGLKIIESPVPVGATPEYLSGHYMLQSAASMCPVLALDPQPKERVLDMSAAPGGKTSYIAQLMRNTGVVFANDLRPDRQKATVANMHRLGVKNVVACTHDGRKLGKLFKHYRFDRVLLDAPCSGLGVISRDPSVKVQRTLADVNKCAHLQKELLLAAIDVLNHKSKTSKGTMVYSTCSVSVAENEEVINYALQKRDIRIIDTSLDFGKPGYTRYQQKRFHPSVANTRRFYPHVHNMDGFFVAKIQKLSDRRPGEDPAPESTEADEPTRVEATNGEKSDTMSSKDRHQRGTESGKKRQRKGPGREEKKEPKKKARSDQLSIPPVKPKQKGKRLNAKMTKPRRQKEPPSM